jgi:polyhydroxyalkanoate synthesis regulator phasin
MNIKIITRSQVEKIVRDEMLKYTNSTNKELDKLRKRLLKLENDTKFR